MSNKVLKFICFEQDKVDHQRELDLLQQEGEIPLEELLRSLPPEMLEERSSSEESDGSTSSSDEDGSGDDGRYGYTVFWQCEL